MFLLPPRVLSLTFLCVVLSPCPLLSSFFLSFSLSSDAGVQSTAYRQAGNTECLTFAYEEAFVSVLHGAPIYTRDPPHHVCVCVCVQSLTARPLEMTCNMA